MDNLALCFYSVSLHLHPRGMLLDLFGDVLVSALDFFPWGCFASD